MALGETVRVVAQEGAGTGPRAARDCGMGLPGGGAGDMGPGQVVTVAGIGCRQGVTVAEVLAAVAATRAGRRLDALAAVPGKSGELALAEAAARLGVPLVFGAVEDGDARLATRSAASLAATGVGSASEAAALAAAGPGARLVVSRRVVGRVTCAIAATEEA